MKNIVYLVIDAFCYDNLERKIGLEEVTPFLNKLKKMSIYSDKMFAQSPYTEAALVTLLSGENTLDNGGYLFGNNNVKKTIFEKLKSDGYKTFSQYSPYVYSKAYLRGVDEFYYTRLYSIKILFSYRLSYYKNKYIKKILLPLELKVCELLLEEAFETWIIQIENLKSKNHNTDLIRDWVNLDKILYVEENLKIEKKGLRKQKKYI